MTFISGFYRMKRFRTFHAVARAYKRRKQEKMEALKLKFYEESFETFPKVYFGNEDVEVDVVVYNNPSIEVMETDGEFRRVNYAEAEEALLRRCRGETKKEKIEGIRGIDYVLESRQIALPNEEEREHYELWRVLFPSGRERDAKIVNVGPNTYWNVCVGCGRVAWLTGGNVCAACEEEEVL